MKKFFPVIVFFILVFLAGWIQHDDSDIYGHFTIGKIITQQGILNHEVVSQAGTSRPYIPTEWLFQIVLYLFLTAFTFTSFHAFTAILTVLQTAALYFLLRNVIRVNQLFSLLLSASYVFLNYQFMVARPQIFADLFLLLTFIILLKYLMQGKNYLFFLLPIVYAWANLHLSVVISILLCLAYSGICFLGIFSKNRKAWLKKSGILGIYGVGMIIVSILPPQNLNVYQDLWLMDKYNYIMTVINQEWTPLYVNKTILIFYSCIIAVAIICFGFVVIKKKLFTKSIWMLPLLAFLPYGYLSFRNIYFGYLAATILVGWALAYVTFRRWSNWKIFILIIFAVPIFTGELWIAVFYNKLTTNQWPDKAADFILLENIQGNMFNQFGYGNYLEYRLYPSHKVFMDGRAEPFFCCEMQDYYNLSKDKIKILSVYIKNFNNLLDKYHSSYAIFATKSAEGYVMSLILKRNPQWFLVYKDDMSEIWIKKDGKNNRLLEKMSTNQSGQQAISAVSIFSSKDMNITFNYPKTIQLTQINPQLIAISTASSTATENSLLIFATTVSGNNLQLPFPVTGKLKGGTMIPKLGFDAKQLIYSDGSKETDLLVFRQKQQLIVMRIPEDTTLIAQAITDIVDSLKTLH